MPKISVRGKGRPRAFETPEDLADAIQSYFDSITIDVPRTKAVVDYIENEGEPNEKTVYKQVPLLDNAGNQVVSIEWVKEPQVIGLCLYLEVDTETLSNYEKRKDYFGTVSRAKQIILDRKLGLLTELKNPRGLMFDLSANYGIIEKKQQDITHDMTKMPAINIIKPK